MDERHQRQAGGSAMAVELNGLDGERFEEMRANHGFTNRRLSAVPTWTAPGAPSASSDRYEVPGSSRVHPITKDEKLESPRVPA